MMGVSTVHPRLGWPCCVGSDLIDHLYDQTGTGAVVLVAAVGGEISE